MFLFYLQEAAADEEADEFQYIPCFYFTDENDSYTVNLMHFNTYHVSILPYGWIFKKQTWEFQYIPCFYFTLKPYFAKEWPEAFQYIPCFYFTSVVHSAVPRKFNFNTYHVSILQIANTCFCVIGIFQYIPCFYFTLPYLPYLHHFPAFQYIPCFYFTQTHHIGKYLSSYFNTYHVSILHPCQHHIKNHTSFQYIPCFYFTCLHPAFYIVQPTFQYIPCFYFTRFRCNRCRNTNVISIHTMFLFYLERSSLLILSKNFNTYHVSILLRLMLY